jgi:hypothetical protein
MGKVTVNRILYTLALVAAAGCGRTGDGLERRLSLGFQSQSRPIAVGVELSLAVERPRERGHFCVGHCGLDRKLEPLSLTNVFTSDASRVQVLSLDDSDPRAPLVRIRTLSPGEVTLTVQARSGKKMLEDKWVLETRPLERIEVSQTRLPENARVELVVKPVTADGHEVYAGPIAAILKGAAELADEGRVAYQVVTAGPGLATLELRTANRTQIVPLEIGQVAHASR